ncbi:LysR family transcriptional regulator [Comamonas piscis]|uniref:LysR family transcriptional regulator n=1 Tax=Comamonas piscis TaxID=1562974 RepID=A0A7G5EK94_9BURK|nr:LysR substrate-binding domain-containing protein [Comamonas piscis]QMV74419.1 LysR family transcriptional regulator [Comamonas piscis]WSO32873.1 LysR substrate-binding domain-containing protein [Comamonas piscis]
MDRLHAIDVFLAIADLGSLTRAAEALELSLPSVVRTLAALEKHLGVRLFNRNTRRLAITDEGRAYRVHALAIRAAVADSEQAMRRAQAEPSGSISLTASVKFGELHVAPLVASYLQRYPQVEVQLLLLDRVVNLVEEGLDLAVRIAPLPDSSLVARHVVDIHQVIAASPALVAACGMPQQPQDLAALPCIEFGGVGDANLWEFVSQGRLERVKVQGRMRCNTVGGNIAGCMAGQGFGRFLHYQVLDAIARGELVRILPGLEPAPRPLSLVYPSKQHGTARVATLVEHLSEHLRARLGEFALPTEQR